MEPWYSSLCRFVNFEGAVCKYESSCLWHGHATYYACLGFMFLRNSSPLPVYTDILLPRRDRSVVHRIPLNDCELA